MTWQLTLLSGMCGLGLAGCANTRAYLIVDGQEHMYLNNTRDPIQDCGDLVPLFDETERIYAWRMEGCK